MDQSEYNAIKQPTIVTKQTTDNGTAYSTYPQTNITNENNKIREDDYLPEQQQQQQQYYPKTNAAAGYNSSFARAGSYNNLQASSQGQSRVISGKQKTTLSGSTSYQVMILKRIFLSNPSFFLFNLENK